MADSIGVYSASGLVYTGKGQLTGVIISTSAASGTASLDDSTDGTGTKLFEVIVSAGHPAIIFFSDRFAPRFATGLYITLAANMTATLWSAQFV
jgi:hypothetical protein